MNTEILRSTLSLPTSPFHEHTIAAHVCAFARKRKSPVHTDRFGNLIVRYRCGRAKPIAFVAHMDHPGFEVQSVRGTKATLLSFGDTRGHNAVGARIACGRICGEIEAVDGQRVSARFSGTVTVGDFAQWDFPVYQRRGKRIYSRAIDDVAGCAALLCALDKLEQTKATANLYAIFTRAEEVGFAGATALASGGLLPKSLPIVSIEMSKMLPGAEQGKGYVVRLGDRAGMFDAHLTNFLLRIARELAGGKSPLPFQQRLMDGGVCEATAFCAMGYAASGVCLALGNYHNQGAKGIASEFIHADDFAGLVQVIVASCQRSGEFCATRAQTKKRVLGLFRQYRKRLLTTAI